MKKEVKNALLMAPLLTPVVTPLMLMSTPVTAEPIPVQHSYSHTVQTSSVFVNSQWTGTCISTMTANGTQTYGYDGSPSDSDGDSDESGADC